MKFTGIIGPEKLKFVGMHFFGDLFEKASAWSEENEIGALWRRFGAFWEANPESIPKIKNPGTSYEIHVETEETQTKGLFDVFAGVMVETIESIPLPCVARELPFIRYAVFTAKGEEIVSDWGNFIYREWFPNSGYELAYRYSVLSYDKRFRGMNEIESSEIDVYIPVKPREE